jgi:hypothetical protein
MGNLCNEAGDITSASARPLEFEARRYWQRGGLKNTALEIAQTRPCVTASVVPRRAAITLFGGGHAGEIDAVRSGIVILRNRRNGLDLSVQ